MEAVKSLAVKGMFVTRWQECNVQCRNKITNTFEVQQRGVQLDGEEDAGQQGRIDVD